MAVGPVLPWRAASGELLRNRLLIPAWVGGDHARRRGARGRARHRQRARVRARRLRAREHRPLGRHRRPRPAARDRDEAVAASRPRARCAATRGCTAVCSCTSASSWSRSRSRRPAGTRRSARCSSCPGESARRARLHGDVPRPRRSSRSAQKTTIKARVQIGGVGDARRPRSRRSRTSAEGIGTPSIHTHAVARLCTSRSSRRPRPGAVTIGVQVGTMVMWFWIGGLIMALGTRSRWCRRGSATSLAGRDRPRSTATTTSPRRSSRSRPDAARVLVGSRSMVARGARRVRRRARGAAPHGAVDAAARAGARGRRPTSTLTTLDGKPIDVARSCRARPTS